MLSDPLSHLTRIAKVDFELAMDEVAKFSELESSYTKMMRESEDTTPMHAVAEPSFVQSVSPMYNCRLFMSHFGFFGITKTDTIH